MRFSARDDVGFQFGAEIEATIVLLALAAEVGGGADRAAAFGVVTAFEDTA